MSECVSPHGLLTEKCPWEPFVCPVQKHLPHTYTHTHAHTETTNAHIHPSLSLSFAPSLLSPLYLLQGTQRHISLGRTPQAVPACRMNQPTCTFLTFSACTLHTRLSSLLTSTQAPSAWDESIPPLTLQPHPLASSVFKAAP